MFGCIQSDWKTKEKKAYAIHNERTNELKSRQNIEKFSAIIDLFEKAIDVARVAIDSGDYKRVWKAIPEGHLMTVAKSIKHLPELKNIGIDLLRELSDGIEGEAMAEIEEVIRAAEAAIPQQEEDLQIRFKYLK